MRAFGYTLLLAVVSIGAGFAPELGADAVCGDGTWSDDEWCIEGVTQLPDVDGDPYAFRLAVGPMAGNPGADLAFSRLFASGSGLKWGTNNGLAGTFGWAGGGGFHDVEAANFNKDGWGDLIAGNGQGVDLRLGATFGHINFTKVYDVPLSFAPTEIEVADIDGDGDTDFVALTANGDLMSARYFLQPVVGPNFSTVDTGMDADLHTLGDMGDTKLPELIRVQNNGSGFISILAHHNHQGYFANDVVLMAKFHDFNGRVDLLDVEAGDFDGDGFADVAVATSAGLMVTLSSNWTPPIIYGGYNTVESMTTADFNKDGRDDLILASADGKLRWLRAKPNGAFDVARVQTVPRDYLITDIEAGDFDRDGWLDVVYTDVFHIYELLSNP